MLPIKQIIQESMNKNPMGLREALEEELRSRIELALEAKVNESADLTEAFRVGSKVKVNSERDDDHGKSGKVVRASRGAYVVQFDNGQRGSFNEDELMNESLELEEAKMTDAEVLSAAKSLAANGKDAKTKAFGKGLVDFYKKEGSFTPAQVGGLQNIMKNASFQMAKESVDIDENVQLNEYAGFALFANELAAMADADTITSLQAMLIFLSATVVPLGVFLGFISGRFKEWVNNIKLAVKSRNISEKDILEFAKQLEEIKNSLPASKKGYLTKVQNSLSKIDDVNSMSGKKKAQQIIDKISSEYKMNEGVELDEEELGEDGMFYMEAAQCLLDEGLEESDLNDDELYEFIVGAAKMLAKGAYKAAVNNQGNFRLSTAGRADSAEAQLRKREALARDRERLKTARARLQGKLPIAGGAAKRPVQRPKPAGTPKPRKNMIQPVQRPKPAGTPTTKRK